VNASYTRPTAPGYLLTNSRHDSVRPTQSRDW